MKYAASFERQKAMYSVFEQGQWYCVRHLYHYDFVRQNAYQRLRADIFVKQLGWETPIDARGRERDRYDEMSEDRVQVSCVYGKHRNTEYLLGGVRTHMLKKWDDSMSVNEFHSVGMIPSSVVSLLKDRYDPTELLEVTRLCLRRGRAYEIQIPENTGHKPSFQLGIARDLVYAAIFAQFDQSRRKLVLSIVDRYFLQVMRRSHFVFEELYTHPQGGRGGYSLTVLNLLETIIAMENAGAYDQIQRILSLCTQPIMR
jgi:hypothetical protein